jgi:hypothetical protein
MNVGLDLDETITEMPWMFSLITTGLKAAGHKVYILTYRDSEERQRTVEELVDHSIVYDQLYVAPADVDAPEWKAKMATELHLDVMFDDAPEVLDALPEFTKRIWVCDRDVFDLGVVVGALQDHTRLPVIK